MEKMDFERFEKALRVLAIALFLLLVLSLIPIVHVAFSSYPAADDFSYVANTAPIWRQTHSLTAVFSAAWQHVQQTYQTWQGSFVAVFLMCLQPGFLDTSLYFAGCLVLLFSFVFCSFFLFYTLARRLLECERVVSLIVAFTLVFLSLQFTYDPVESFFWYNGGVYYTFFYSLCALLFGLLARAFTSQRKKVAAIQYAFCLPLAFLIGGGSFPPSLASLVVLSLMALFFGWKRRPLRAAGTCLVLAAMAASFFINVLAPGNAIRQMQAGSPHSPVTAILLSLVYGAYAFCNCTSLPVIAGWAFLTPFLYRAVARLRFTFPFPLLFAGLLFGIFSAQGTPVFYALGMNMPERVINIIYFSCYPYTLLAWSYFLGWLSHREWWTGFLARAGLRWSLSGGAAFCAVVLCAGAAGTLGLIHVGKDPNSGNMQMTGLPLSAQAAVCLATGEAQDFHAQLLEREATYCDESLSHVRVESLRSKPVLLFIEDIQEDPAYWVNQSIAKFFEKDSVALASGN